MDLSSPSTVYRWLASGLALLIFKVAADRALSLRMAFAKIKNYPGCMPLWLNPYSLVAFMLGVAFPRPGMGGYYAAKFSFYNKFGATSYSSVLMSTARPHFWFADAEAVKIIVSDRYTFPKDVTFYQFINFYGKNIIGVEGSDWKRHRSVAMSAFNEENLALVWLETMRVLNEWFEQLDSVGPHVAVNMLQHMEQMTLVILVSAAFGKQLSLTTDSMTKLPPGCKLTFQSAVLSSVNNVIFSALVPQWFYTFSSLIKLPYLSSRALFARLALEDLRTHMFDLVASARADVMSREYPGGGGAALLRNLVEASMNQDRESKRLTEDEVFSNIFAFLLAGNETSAHVLCFAFSLLALYPDCQQKIYEEVTRVWPADVSMRSATCHKKHADNLEYTLACIRETLRIFPSAVRIPKEVHTDTILPGTYFNPGPDGHPVETGKFSMSVPAGSIVNLDVWALHMNPLYWGKDATEFKPERFIDTESYQWPRNAYLPFSAGARSCIGQRFALIEMVGVVASVVRRYRILTPDNLANKPLEAQKEALLTWKIDITLKPTNAHVKLHLRV